MNDERNLGEKTDDSGQQPRYEHYQFHEEQGTVLKPSGPSGHRRNQNSFQKKAGATIALAVIFGLVAAPKSFQEIKKGQWLPNSCHILQ